jgi:hypothetical protein
MKEARILEAVEARKLTVTMDIDSAPEVVKEGVLDGVYVWILRFPATIKFDGNSPLGPIPVLLTVQVSRVSTLQNSAGIGIENWIAAERK